MFIKLPMMDATRFDCLMRFERMSLFFDAQALD